MTTTENNSLFTEVTVEESANVCGGTSLLNITAQIFKGSDNSVLLLLPLGTSNTAVAGVNLNKAVSSNGTVTKDSLVAAANSVGIDTNTANSILADLQKNSLQK